MSERIDGTITASIGYVDMLRGKDGESAFELAVEQGYTGTLDEWLASLKGEKGDAGEQGSKGDTGPQGEKGDKGDTGAQGIQGEKGEDGKTPVKGTDYFTNEDKVEMEATVKGDIKPYVIEVNETITEDGHFDVTPKEAVSEVRSKIKEYSAEGRNVQLKLRLNSRVVYIPLTTSIYNERYWQFSAYIGDNYILECGFDTPVFVSATLASGADSISITVTSLAPCFIQEEIDSKQDKLTAGTNITIDGTTISAEPYDDTEVKSLISAETSARESAVKKVADSVTSLQTTLEGKQDALTAGTGISIVDGVISCSFEDGSEVNY